MHEGDGRPAIPTEPAQHHPEEVRGGCEESRLLPVSGKAYYRAFFVNFSTAGAFVLYAFALRLQGFSLYSVPSSDIFTADCIEQILFFLGVIGMRPLYQPES